jgi:hypothetical protein
MKHTLFVLAVWLMSSQTSFGQAGKMDAYTTENKLVAERPVNKGTTVPVVSNAKALAALPKVETTTGKPKAVTKNTTQAPPVVDAQTLQAHTEALLANTRAVQAYAQALAANTQTVQEKTKALEAYKEALDENTASVKQKTKAFHRYIIALEKNGKHVNAGDGFISEVKEEAAMAKAGSKKAARPAFISVKTELPATPILAAAKTVTKPQAVPANKNIVKQPVVVAPAKPAVKQNVAVAVKPAVKPAVVADAPKIVLKEQITKANIPAAVAAVSNKIANNASAQNFAAVIAKKRVATKEMFNETCNASRLLVGASIDKAPAVIHASKEYVITKAGQLQRTIGAEPQKAKPNTAIAATLDKIFDKPQTAKSGTLQPAPAITFVKASTKEEEPIVFSAAKKTISLKAIPATATTKKPAAKLHRAYAATKKPQGYQWIRPFVLPKSQAKPHAVLATVKKPAVPQPARQVGLANTPAKKAAPAVAIKQPLSMPPARPILLAKASVKKELPVIAMKKQLGMQAPHRTLPAKALEKKATPVIAAKKSLATQPARPIASVKPVQKAPPAPAVKKPLAAQPIASAKATVNKQTPRAETNKPSGLQPAPAVALAKAPEKLYASTSKMELGPMPKAQMSVVSLPTNALAKLQEPLTAAATKTAVNLFASTANMLAKTQAKPAAQPLAVVASAKPAVALKEKNDHKTSAAQQVSNKKVIGSQMAWNANSHNKKPAKKEIANSYRTVKLNDLLQLPLLKEMHNAKANPNYKHAARRFGLTEGEVVTTKGYIQVVATENAGKPNEVYLVQLSLNPKREDACFIIRIPTNRFASPASKIATANAKKFICEKLVEGRVPCWGGNIMRHPVYVSITGTLAYNNMRAKAMLGAKPNYEAKRNMHAYTAWEIGGIQNISFSVQ